MRSKTGWYRQSKVQRGGNVALIRLCQRSRARNLNLKNVLGINSLLPLLESSQEFFQLQWTRTFFLRIKRQKSWPDNPAINIVNFFSPKEFFHLYKHWCLKTGLHRWNNLSFHSLLPIPTAKKLKTATIGRPPNIVALKFRELLS